jgi:hypothetical protein
MRPRPKTQPQLMPARASSLATSGATSDLRSTSQWTWGFTATSAVTSKASRCESSRALVVAAVPTVPTLNYDAVHNGGVAAAACFAGASSSECRAQDYFYCSAIAASCDSLCCPVRTAVKVIQRGVGHSDTDHSHTRNIHKERCYRSPRQNIYRAKSLRVGLRPRLRLRLRLRLSRSIPCSSRLPHWFVKRQESSHLAADVPCP